MIVGSASVWAETKPWSCADPTTTLDLQTITSETMGTWADAKSWYLDDDYLVVSGVASYKSVGTGKQTWITQSSVGSSTSTWNASTPFQGSDYYTTKSYATLQSGRALVYRVTNLKSLKVYGKNNTTTKYLDIFIYTKSDDDYTKVEEITYTTDANVHIWESSATLDPSETYFVYLTGVDNSNSRVFEVAFERNSGDAEDPTLSFPESSYNAVLGTTFTAPELTSNSKGTLSYESSNTDVATVTNDGTVTLKACGTTVITARTAATSKYTAGSAQYTLNVNTVAPPTITYDGAEYASGEFVTKRAGKTLTFTTTAPDAEIWYTTDGTDPDATAATPVGGTKYTSALTVNATTTYKVRTYVLDVDLNDVQSTVSTFTVNITTEKETPTFSFASSEESVTYGNDFTKPVLTNTSTATPVFTSSEPSVASVDAEGNVTIKAVGETTITASIDATEDYKAAEDSYTLTVLENASAPTITAETRVFYESFDKCNSTGGNDDSWSGSIADGTITTDITGWNFVQGSGASKCVRFGTSKNAGSATTPALGLEGDFTLKFKMASWSGDTNDGYVDIEGGGTFDDNKTTRKISVEKAEWKEFSLALKNVTSTTKIKFYHTGKKRLFLDEVALYKPETPTISYTVPTSGWGTFCSPYALDLGNEATTVTAYTVSAYDVDENSITLVKQTGKVQAKTPLVIQGEAGTKTIAVTTETGDDLSASNILRGYLSPTYYAGADATETLMGMSGGNFKKLKEGTIPANRAALVMTTADFSKLNPLGEGKFNFIIVDGSETTRIESVHHSQFIMHGNAPMYNLAGQQVRESYKGIVIINGKKVVRK